MSKDGKLDQYKLDSKRAERKKYGFKITQQRKIIRIIQILKFKKLFDKFKFGCFTKNVQIYVYIKKAGKKLSSILLDGGMLTLYSFIA